MFFGKIIMLIKEMGIAWLLRRVLYELLKKSGYQERKAGYRCPKPDIPGLADGTVKQFFNDWCGHFFLPELVTYAASYDLFLAEPDRAHIMQVADNSIRGVVKCFSSWYGNYGRPNIWFTDPLSGREVPCDRHWSRLNELSGGTDIKLVWELSRFPQVYYLVRAYGLTGDHKYARVFWEQVESWIESNPYQKGPNWFCGQEAAIRVMAWTFGLFAFKDSPCTTADRVKKLVASIYCHGIRIEQNINYAVKLVKNNHAISESAGLFTIGVLFPFLRRSSRWRSLGYRHLVSQGLRQIYPDGSYLQHSFNYQRLVIQLYSWCIRLGKVNGIKFDGSLVERLSKCVDFLYQLQDPKTGQVPNYGNNDGSLVFPLTSCDFLDFRPQLNALHFIINNARLYNAGKHEEELFWFCGLNALQSGAAKKERMSTSFESGGYFVLRSTQGFGFTRCASYKDRPAQSDMLHFDLWWNGRNILCDAGTYLYNCDPKWSNYFCGTKSHNTVTIDNKNQMNRLGTFLWCDWVKSRLIGFGRRGKYQYFEGEHYGYKNVVHRRAIINVGEAWFVIDDIFGSSTGVHRVEQHWLLGNMQLTEDGNQNRVNLAFPGGRYLIELMNRPELRIDIKIGLENGSIRGWRSRNYGLKEPVPSIVCGVDTVLPYRLVSAFYPGGSVKNVMLGDRELKLVEPAGKEWFFSLGSIGSGPIING